MYSVVPSLSGVYLFAHWWTVVCQASLSFTVSWTLLKFMSIESVMLSNHPLSPPTPLALNLSSIMVFSNETDICISWPKYWSFSINPSSEYSGLISFRIHWLIFLLSKGFSRLFSITTIQKHQFCGQPCLWTSSRIPTCYWKNTFDIRDLCWQSDAFALKYTVYFYDTFPLMEQAVFSFPDCSHLQQWGPGRLTLPLSPRRPDFSPARAPDRWAPLGPAYRPLRFFTARAHSVTHPEAESGERRSLRKVSFSFSSHVILSQLSFLCNVGWGSLLSRNLRARPTTPSKFRCSCVAKRRLHFALKSLWSGCQRLVPETLRFAPLCCWKPTSEFTDPSALPAPREILLGDVGLFTPRSPGSRSRPLEAAPAPAPGEARFSPRSWDSGEPASLLRLPAAQSSLLLRLVVLPFRYSNLALAGGCFLFSRHPCK